MFEILIVDDENDICWALKTALEDGGFRTTHVTRGEDAIREVEGRSFDAAIIDVKLPGKSGIEVSRTIRRLDPRIKVVMISGYHYEDDQPIREGMRTGEYKGFISKPFELDEVSALLGRIFKDAKETPSPEPSNGTYTGS